MSTRGSALSRALKYFRECDVDEARVAATLVNEIVARRVDGANQVPPKPVRAKRTRRAKSENLDPTGKLLRGETLADA